MRYSTYTVDEILRQGRNRFSLNSEVELLAETLSWLHSERGLTFVSTVEHGGETLMVFRTQGQD